MTFYSEHREEMKAYQREYYWKNLEMCRAYNAAYYQGVTKPARAKLRQRVATILKESTVPRVKKTVRVEPKAKQPKKVKPNIQIAKPPAVPRVTMREGILIDWHA
jgi:hypothetical protein